MTTLFRNTSSLLAVSMRFLVYLFLCVADRQAAALSPDATVVAKPSRWERLKRYWLGGDNTPSVPKFEPEPEWTCETDKNGDVTTWVSNKPIRDGKRSVKFYGEVACKDASLDNDKALNEMFDDGEPPHLGQELPCHADDDPERDDDGNGSSASKQVVSHAGASGKNQPIVIITSPQGWNDRKNPCKKAKEFHSENNSWKCKAANGHAIYTNHDYGSVTFEGLSCVNLPIQVKLKDLFTSEKADCDDTHKVLQKVQYICNTTIQRGSDASPHDNPNPQVYQAEIVPLKDKFMIKGGCERAKEFHEHLSRLRSKSDD